MPDSIDDLLAAVPLARTALLEITPAATIGKQIGHIVEGEGIVSLLFACTLSGYPDWHWTVTVGRAGEDAAVTVLEAELMPGDGALLAPDWVPWSDRLAEYQAAQEVLAAEAVAQAEADEDDDLDDEDDDLDDEDDVLDRRLDGIDIDSVDGGYVEGVDIGYDEETDVDSDLDLAVEEAAALADDEPDAVEPAASAPVLSSDPEVREAETAEHDAGDDRADPQAADSGVLAGDEQRRDEGENPQD